MLAIRDPRSAWLKPAAVSGQALLAQDAHSQPEPQKVSGDGALMEQDAEDTWQLGLESRCALFLFLFFSSGAATGSLTALSDEHMSVKVCQGVEPK